MRDELVISGTTKLVRISDDKYSKSLNDISKYLSLNYRSDKGSNPISPSIKKEIEELRLKLEIILGFDPYDIIAIGDIQEIKPIVTKHIPSYPCNRGDYHVRYHCYGNPESKNPIHHDAHSAFNCIAEMCGNNIIYALINTI